MYSRLLKIPVNKSFFLFGPRGTGKTTWVKHTFPKAIYLDLLETEILNDLRPNAQRLDNFIPKSFSDWIIIDEIQRVPELLNEVHRLIEKKRYKFILTGSSPRKLRKTGQNLLAGRAITLNMHPLTASELGDDFDLSHSLKYGQLPSAYIDNDPKSFLESYVNTYLEEEVRQEGLTRNLGNFARFLESASFSQGSILNISSVSRDCGIERKIAESYFNILDSLLLSHRIHFFIKKAKRHVIAHPKFYLFDTGIFRTLRPMGVLDMPEEAEGSALETLFLQNLVAYNDALRLGYKIYYWKTDKNKEIDFILYGEKGLFAFEVKRSGKVYKSMLSALNSFLRIYPQTKAFFIYGGKNYMRENDIEIIPIIDAIKKIPEILSTGKYKII